MKGNPFKIQEGAVHDRSVSGFNSSRNDGDTLLFLPTFSSWLGKSLKGKKIFLFIFIIGLLFAILIGRVLYLQAWEGNRYRSLSDRNRTKTIRLRAPRGILYDRFGRPLVKNDSRISLYVNRQLLTSAEDRERLEKMLENSLPDHVVRIRSFFNATSTNIGDELLDDDVPYETAIPLLVSLSAEPSAHLAFEPRRDYLASDGLAPVMGYVGKVSDDELAANTGYGANDMIGKQGLEKIYEQMLRGTDGIQRIEVDALGREKGALDERLPTKGTDLTLTIDLEAQKKLFELLNTVYRKHGKASAGVVMDPQSGEILALASAPSFDANLFGSSLSAEEFSALRNDPHMPLFMRAVAGTYPAGSIFKMTVAAAALEEGVINDRFTVNSTGGLYLGDRFFADWRPGGHGITNIYKAIADSVNTFFYIIGGGSDALTGLGIDKIADYAHRFGFGSITGIDLPGEADGFVPSRAWKESSGDRWYQGDTYNLSIGQGSLLVTPLQVARYTSYFANKGKLVTPHLLRQIMSAETQQQAVQNVALPVSGITERTIDIIRSGLRQTVTNGTAQSMQAVPVAVAGKTGTAQFNANKLPHSWFTGFAPYDNPTAVVTVLVEEGGDLGYAVQVAREFLQWYYTPT